MPEWAATYDALISEAALQRAITDACDVLGLHYFHIRDSRGQQATGFPDLVIANWRAGALHVWELKSERGKLSAEQEAWHQALLGCQRLDVAIVRPHSEDWALAQLQGGAE